MFSFEAGVAYCAAVFSSNKKVSALLRGLAPCHKVCQPEGAPMLAAWRMRR